MTPRRVVALFVWAYGAWLLLTWTVTFEQLVFGGLLAAAAFVVVELRGDHPLLPVRLFGDRAFTTGVVSLTLQYLASFGLFLLVPQYLQLILGYAPVRAAVAVSPMSVPLLVLCVLASRLTARLGLRVMTASGLATFAVGLFLMSRLDVHADYLDVLWPVLIVGAGLGLCTAPATSAIITSTPAAKHGVASAVNDATREIGAATGIAIAGSVLAAGYRTRSGRTAGQARAHPRASGHGASAAALGRRRRRVHLAKGVRLDGGHQAAAMGTEGRRDRDRAVRASGA